MTQTSNSETSNQADAVSSAPFVLDFLYNDSRRIGSFLSQFEVDGHLQSFVRHKDGTKAKTDKSSADLKGSIAAIGAGRATSTETKFEAKEGYSQTFDPLWSNAKAFLDFLSDRNLLRIDPASASIGQFILAKGSLSILDLSMLQHMWKMTSIQKKMREGFAPTRKVANMTAHEKKEYQEAQDNANIMFEMMQAMPHAIHASLFTFEKDPMMMWGSLQSEYLTMSANDITLAYGDMMPGTWSCVGILNDHPHYGITPNTDPENLDGMQSMVGGISKMFAPIIRATLGRPAYAHSITPLLIFREVE